MRRPVIITALAAITVATGCDFLGIGDTRIRLYEVAPFKGNCQGLFETLCLQVREPGEEAYGNLFETPRGFSYDWGFQYLIRVEERDLDEVPADASSIERTLDRQLSRTPVDPGTTFEVTVPSGFLTAAAPGRYDLDSESLTLACPELLDCGALDTLVADQTRLRFTLAFPDPPSSPLLVHEWQECPPNGPCEGSSEATSPH